MFDTKTFILAAGLAVVGAASNAAILDFTVDATPAVLSGTVDGVGYTITAAPSAVTNAEAGPGPIVTGVGATLDGDRDGFGISDDELTNGSESLTISFASSVRIASLFFLDLFDGTGAGADIESAIISGDATGEFFGTATDTIGFHEELGTDPILGLNFVGQTFTFTAGAGDDTLTGGAPDFALAGIEVFASSNITDVPLPAGVLLLGGALGGLGFARRARRKA